MSMDEYLSSSSNERGAELEANVVQHQGFTGGIDEYLSGDKPQANNANAKNNSANKNNQAENTGKEMKESTSGSQAGESTSLSMDDYLAKFGDGKQTAVSTSSEKPFNQKEHMGFHGSYEDYAKKYN